MKPMLAATTDGKNLRYPLLASPKLDGIRALVIGGVVMSRSMKPIPNLWAQKCFGRPEFNNLDGELIVGDPVDKLVFNTTSSAMMTIKGSPQVVFHLFDDFSDPSLGFSKRLASASRRHAKLRYGPVELVDHEIIYNEMELQMYEENVLMSGYEGVMTRDPDGGYKEGRSTLKQEWLLKLKRFADGEAEIIGMTELMHNANEAKLNELGHKARSSHRSGMVGKNAMGSLIVRDLVSKVTFEIGTGFTQADREIYWAMKDDIIGRIAKYKHFPVGAKDKPRFPVFVGFRDPIDL